MSSHRPRRWPGTDLTALPLEGYPHPDAFLSGHIELVSLKGYPGIQPLSSMVSQWAIIRFRTGGLLLTFTLWLSASEFQGHVFEMLCSCCKSMGLLLSQKGIVYKILQSRQLRTKEFSNRDPHDEDR
jgi:hypothetical protein